MRGALAVALHDVEPRSFARARELRDWLSRRGIARVTLLVIPAPNLRPIGAGTPLVAWLRARVACGDAVAQHGLTHRLSATPPWPRKALVHWQANAAAEFPGLRCADAAARVQIGRRLLEEVQLHPGGFVAPGYAYTRGLRAVLSESFDWFADVRAVHCRAHGKMYAPALCLGTSTHVKRALSPPIVRAAGRIAGPVVRVDVHPTDFELKGHVRTLEALLERGSGRDVATYDDLFA